MELRRVEGQPEMPEHALDGMAGGQGGNDLHAPFATRALEDVVQKDPPDHRRPRKAAPSRWSPVGAAVRACGLYEIDGGNRRDDSGAGSECRGEYAKVAAEVGPWTRNERDQALDQFVRREYERGRAIAPGTLELELQAAVVEPGEPIAGYWRAGQIPPHALEPFAIIGSDTRGGLEVEPFDFGAQTTEKESVNGRRRAADANDALTAPRAGGARSADRRLGYCGEERRRFDEVLVSWARLSTGELARDPSENGRGDQRDILVGRSGRRMEDWRPAEGEAVNPVNK